MSSAQYTREDCICAPLDPEPDCPYHRNREIVIPEYYECSDASHRGLCACRTDGSNSQEEEK